jgi:hypothetical protein
MTKELIRIAAGMGVAAAIGVAALGIGTATANAAPPAAQAGFAQWGPGWRPGPGPWRPGAPPTPPPPAWGYNYGGWGNYGPLPPPCASGPLGFVSVCA